MPDAWHREAYFGQLLQGVSRAVAIHDSFAAFVPAPASTDRLLYLLVTETAPHGDLRSYLTKQRSRVGDEGVPGDRPSSCECRLELHEAGASHVTLRHRTCS